MLDDHPMTRREQAIPCGHAIQGSMPAWAPFIRLYNAESRG
jgi:hypothetical protein